MYAVRRQIVSAPCYVGKSKAGYDHVGYTLQGAIESLADHANVPVELGTIDVVASDVRSDGLWVWHLWIEHDGVPVQPLMEADELASAAYDEYAGHALAEHESIASAIRVA